MKSLFSWGAAAKPTSPGAVKDGAVSETQSASKLLHDAQTTLNSLAGASTIDDSFSLLNAAQRQGKALC